MLLYLEFFYFFFFIYEFNEGRCLVPIQCKEETKKSRGVTNCFETRILGNGGH